MKCEVFRTLDDFGTPEALAHLRSCEACMNFAMERDPEVFFRSLGGDELVPPGGVDAFVDDVMREVQLRDKQKAWSAHRVASPWSRWSAAAAVLVAALSYTAAHRPMPHAPTGVASIVAQSAPTVTRPVIESYDNSGATIVEVPTQQNDAKIVMVFDESLPADL